MILNRTYVVREAICYLNSVAGTNYSDTNKNTQNSIFILLDSGYTLDDLKSVVDKKWEQWKGTDYQKGGGYIELDEKRYLFEDYTLAGDIVIYDGRTMHGVEDIDPLHPLELDQFGGRAAGFVSLFKHLQGGGNEYAKMSTEAVEKYISNH